MFQDHRVIHNRADCQREKQKETKIIPKVTEEQKRADAITEQREEHKTGKTEEFEKNKERERTKHTGI